MLLTGEMNRHSADFQCRGISYCCCRLLNCWGGVWCRCGDPSDLHSLPAWRSSFFRYPEIRIPRFPKPWIFEYSEIGICGYQDVLGPPDIGIPQYPASSGHMIPGDPAINSTNRKKSQQIYCSMGFIGRKTQVVQEHSLGKKAKCLASR